MKTTLPAREYTAHVVDTRIRKVRNKPYRRLKLRFQIEQPENHSGQLIELFFYSPIEEWEGGK